MYDPPGRKRRDLGTGTSISDADRAFAKDLTLDGLGTGAAVSDADREYVKRAARPKGRRGEI